MEKRVVETPNENEKLSVSLVENGQALASVRWKRFPTTASLGPEIRLRRTM